MDKKTTSIKYQFEVREEANGNWTVVRFLGRNRFQGLEVVAYRNKNLAHKVKDVLEKAENLDASISELDL